MKIIVVGPVFPDSFARNIVVTLQALGHEVLPIAGTRAYHHQRRISHLFWEYVPKAFPAVERAGFKRIIAAASRTQPDLILVTNAATPPEIVEELRNSCAAKLACWYTDSAANVYRQYLIGCRFDACFLKEPFLVRALTDKVGLAAYYLPECCNPLWHNRRTFTDDARKPYACDVAGIGSLHYYRARMLEVFQGYDMKIWGGYAPAWLASPAKSHYTYCFVAEETKAKAFTAAKILVNTIHCFEIEAVNCTCFEAAACGAFQIADWKPALPDLFEPEKEIVTFRTRAELKGKVDYYLAHPDERAEIADRARVRAHRDHTYETRLTRMFSVLGLSGDQGKGVDCGITGEALDGPFVK